MKAESRAHVTRLKTSSRGSGLIENMMAMAVFSAGMVSVVGMTNQLVYVNELANEESAATILARNLFEDIRTRDPEEREALGITSGTAGPMNASGELVASGRYSMRWDITDSLPHEGMEMVTIYITWTDARGKSREQHFHSGLRKGWPTPVIIPETQTDHGHGQGHNPKSGTTG